MQGLKEFHDVKTPRKPPSSASSRHSSPVISEFSFAKRRGEKRKPSRPAGLVLPTQAVKAATAGDLRGLRRMMADGTVPHVDVFDEKGRTLLHLAVMHGNLATVQFLCTYSADVMRNNADGSSPLALAEECNRPTIARFLGLWAHVTTCCPTTALHLCALQGNTIEMMNVLRSGRVEIDYEETYGHHTALHLAVKGGQVECVKLLVLSGADPNRRHSVSAESALVSAVIQNDAHLVGFLLSKGAIPRTQYAGSSLLQWAIDNKRSSTVTALLNDFSTGGQAHYQPDSRPHQRQGQTQAVAQRQPVFRDGGSQADRQRHEPPPVPRRDLAFSVHEEVQRNAGNPHMQAAAGNGRVNGPAHTDLEYERRAERSDAASTMLPRHGIAVVRGKCGACGQDVKTSHQRIFEQGVVELLYLSCSSILYRFCASFVDRQSSSFLSILTFRPL